MLSKNNYVTVVPEQIPIKILLILVLWLGTDEDGVVVPVIHKQIDHVCQISSIKQLHWRHHCTLTAVYHSVLFLK